MPKITKIERHKHKDTRVSVFVDDEYAFSLSDEIVIAYGVAVGMDVNSLPLKEMAEEDEYKRAMSCAFTHMSRSEKSEKQLREHLIKKEFSPKTVEKIIVRLKELNYIDDENLARNFVEHSSFSGKKAIAFKLKTKGISDEIINEVLENVTEEEQLEKAIELAQKQLPKYKKYELYHQKRRINDFLGRKGFDWEIVSAAIEKVFNSEDY